MAKRQKKVDGAQDRLSELPDSLILEILSFLDMRDVVRTNLLSKRWKGLWTGIRCLYFDESGKNDVRSRNFINRALMLWKVTNSEIQKKFGRDMPNTLSGDMNFAAARKVEELYLQFPCKQPLTQHYGYNYCALTSEIDMLYRPPQWLYSCSSISKLTLIGCILRVRENTNVQWDRLKSFTFHASCIHDNLISQVVSGAPRLENFELHLLRSYGNVSIRSSSLKKLSIIKHLDINSGTNDKSLTIWAPKLEALVLSGAAYNECLLMDVSSLTNATLDFTSVSREVELTLQQILPIIQHVGAITLSTHCIEMMMNGVVKGISLNAKVVTAPIEPEHIDRRLGLFPKLKMLIIDLNARSPNDQDIGLLDAYVRKALMQLTTVEITWYSYEASMFQYIEFLLKRATMIEKIVIKKGMTGRSEGMFQFIKFLLKHATMIEKIVIKEGKTVRSEDMFLAARKNMSSQKSFPTVDLILDTK